jgi:hypothetical protein
MCHAVAFMVLSVGLISPLTPATGRPSLGEFLFYAGVPFALLCVCWVLTRDRAGRIAIAVELVALGGLVVLLVAHG